MSGEQELRISRELCHFSQSIVKASIIESHPNISDAELKTETIKRFSS
jgi:hypothetical protein